MDDGQTMNILILGATGFIGSAVAQKLLADGHIVTGIGRNPDAARRREPRVRWIDADLRKFKTASDWLPLLTGIKAIVNCAGVLQDSSRDDVAAVQEHAMLALYAAARQIPGLRFVQVSAARSLASSGTAFMTTKMSADAALAASGLTHFILRPSLVLGRNAHGGSALLRALAAFPMVTPLAYPDSLVQTVSLRRVAGEVAKAVNGDTPPASDLDLIDHTATLRSLVSAHRTWLGFHAVPTVPVPAWLISVASSFADLAGRFGWRSPMRSTAMAITQGGIVSNQAIAETSGSPLPLDMLDHPAGAQDVWFARLYLAKPLLILTLSLFWIVSGIVPLLDPLDVSQKFASILNGHFAMGVTVATSLADIALGVAVLFRAHARMAMLGMIGLSFAYLAGGTIIEPSLWLDPLGPLVKVFPSLALTMCTLAILEER